ncbi:hypothetical protein [Nonomuraea pusilla]|uniref:SH3 domain-containing protein n=1 Tax=Nonomuraea pusilla TaxID=46177 RepID=A0A1H7IRP6_9ACTN|nr:hypothetical protein [Nonomuraea pusilla]SEK65161.1 hypothetical protein SAMN05660976_00913 [Nonomuraea pusilla]
MTIKRRRKLMTRKNLGALTVAGAAVLVSLLGSSAATAATAAPARSQGSAASHAGTAAPAGSRSVAAAMPGATRPPYAHASHRVGRATQKVTAYNGCDQPVWFKVRIKGRPDTGWMQVGPDGTRSYTWPRWNKFQGVSWYWRGCDLH